MGVDTCIEVRGIRLSDSELRRAAGDLAERLGPHKFWIRPEESQHCLTRADEGFVVNTLWRYYGPGYERGPWPDIRYTLLWLMVRFPSARIYYYGDNNELDPEMPVTREFLEKQDDYFLSRGHAPYHEVFRGIAGDTSGVCSFCERRMMNHGGGQGQTFLSCHGCGQSWIGVAGKLTLLKKGEEFFEASNRVRQQA